MRSPAATLFLPGMGTDEKKWELGVHFVGKTLMDSVSIPSTFVLDAKIQ